MGQSSSLSAAVDREEGLPSPYLLFLGDTVDPGYAKTAFGLRDWAGERCVGEFARRFGLILPPSLGLSIRNKKAITSK